MTMAACSLSQLTVMSRYNLNFALGDLVKVYSKWYNLYVHTNSLSTQTEDDTTPLHTHTSQS